jgi:hypothetical protein
LPLEEVSKTFKYTRKPIPIGKKKLESKSINKNYIKSEIKQQIQKTQEKITKLTQTGSYKPNFRGSEYGMINKICFQLRWISRI